MFNERAGVQIEPVSYRGEGVLMPDLISGTVSMAFVSLSSALPLIREGRLRALAALGSDRLEALPAVPTLAEAGVSGIEIDGWQALFATRSVPPGGVERLAALLPEALADPTIAGRICDLGLLPGSRDRAAFRGVPAGIPAMGQGAARPGHPGAVVRNPQNRLRPGRWAFVTPGQRNSPP